MLGRHDESDDMHEQLRHWVTIEHDGEDVLHGFDLALVGTLFELCPELGHAGNVGRIVLVDQTVGILEEGHGDGGICGQVPARRRGLDNRLQYPSMWMESGRTFEVRIVAAGRPAVKAVEMDVGELQGCEEQERKGRELYPHGQSSSRKWIAYTP